MSLARCRGQEATVIRLSFYIPLRLACRGCAGGGLLERLDRVVARLLRGLQALLRGGEIALELSAQALLGVKAGLRDRERI